MPSNSKANYKFYYLGQLSLISPFRSAIIRANVVLLSYVSLVHILRDYPCYTSFPYSPSFLNSPITGPIMTVDLIEPHVSNRKRVDSRLQCVPRTEVRRGSGRPHLSFLDDEETGSMGACLIAPVCRNTYPQVSLI